MEEYGVHVVEGRSGGHGWVVLRKMRKCIIRENSYVYVCVCTLSDTYLGVHGLHLSACVSPLHILLEICPFCTSTARKLQFVPHSAPKTISSRDKSHTHTLTHVTNLEGGVQLSHMILRAPAGGVDIVGRGVSEGEGELTPHATRV